MTDEKIQSIRAALNGIDVLAAGVHAVILIGSLARGEELRVQREGAVQYLSDAEFMAVVDDDRLSDDEWRKDLEKAITEKVVAALGPIDVSVGFTTRPHLRRLKPHIFTLEFKRFGRVVYGDAEISRFIPQYAAADLLRLDAFVLLNNRMVEQLKVRQAMGGGRPLNRYVIDKGYVQIVNSLLAFEKKYQSLYPEKQAAFQALLLDHPLAKELSGARCLDALDHLIHKDLPDLDPAESLTQWRDLRAQFQAVFCYEAAQILGYYQFSPKDAVKYLPTVPDLLSNIKGWAKLAARKQLGLFSWIEILTHLVSTSPQYLIYQEAAWLYFSDEPDAGDVAAVINRWEKVVK